MEQGKLLVPGRPTNLMIARHGPTALAVGAGGGCLDIFFSSIVSLLFPPLSQGDGPIYTEILSQRAVKPRSTKQPTFSSFLRKGKSYCSYLPAISTFPNFCEL